MSALTGSKARCAQPGTRRPGTYIEQGGAASRPPEPPALTPE